MTYSLSIHMIKSSIIPSFNSPTNKPTILFPEIIFSLSSRARKPNFLSGCGNEKFSNFIFNNNLRNRILYLWNWNERKSLRTKIWQDTALQIWKEKVKHKMKIWAKNWNTRMLNCPNRKLFCIKVKFLATTGKKYVHYTYKVKQFSFFLILF